MLHNFRTRVFTCPSLFSSISLNNIPIHHHARLFWPSSDIGPLWALQRYLVLMATPSYEEADKLWACPETVTYRFNWGDIPSEPLGPPPAPPERLPWSPGDGYPTTPWLLLKSIREEVRMLPPRAQLLRVRCERPVLPEKALDAWFDSGDWRWGARTSVSLLHGATMGGPQDLTGLQRVGREHGRQPHLGLHD